MRFLILKADKLNSNGRIYPQDLIIETIESESFQYKLKNRQFLGFMGQSVWDSNERDIKKASHVLTDVSLEEKNLFGNIEILDTPAGMSLLQALKDGNENFGMAIRGIGDISKNENGDTVVDSLDILSVDYVYKPSHNNKE